MTRPDRYTALLLHAADVLGVAGIAPDGPGSRATRRLRLAAAVVGAGEALAMLQATGIVNSDRNTVGEAVTDPMLTVDVSPMPPQRCAVKTPDPHTASG